VAAKRRLIPFNLAADMDLQSGQAVVWTE